MISVLGTKESATFMITATFADENIIEVYNGIPNSVFLEPHDRTYLYFFFPYEKEEF